MYLLGVNSEGLLKYMAVLSLLPSASKNKYRNMNEHYICDIVHNFYVLEVVDRGSEPQLQVGKNLNGIT